MSVVSVPAAQLQIRQMATLKDISMRLKSVSNIQKITQSMKMVAAAKYAQAERQLKPARAYGIGSNAFYENADLTEKEPEPNHLYVVMTSDRGLCGGVHSNIAKSLKHHLAEKDGDLDSKIVCVGDKSKAMLQRFVGKQFIMTINDIGKKPPTFEDAANLASSLLEMGYNFDQGDIYYNRFKTVVSYETKAMPFYSLERVKQSTQLGQYDSVDDLVLQSYMEFSLASLIFYCMKESACSEQSSRMTAMEAASKNAGEMIDKLRLSFNRTRQSVITRELIEIISGAAAV